MKLSLAMCKVGSTDIEYVNINLTEPMSVYFEEHGIIMWITKEVQK